MDMLMSIFHKSRILSSLVQNNHGEIISYFKCALLCAGQLESLTQSVQRVVLTVAYRGPTWHAQWEWAFIGIHDRFRERTYAAYMLAPQKHRASLHPTGIFRKEIRQRRDPTSR